MPSTVTQVLSALVTTGGQTIHSSDITYVVGEGTGDT